MIQIPKYYPLVDYAPLLHMLLTAFTAILYTLLSALWLKNRQKSQQRRGGYVYGAILLNLSFLAVEDLVGLFVSGTVFQNQALIEAIDISACAAACLMPPLIFHWFYSHGLGYRSRPALWKALLVLGYFLGLAQGTAAINSIVGGWHRGWPGLPTAFFTLRMLLLGSALLSGLALWYSKPASTSSVLRDQRRWLLWFCGAWAAVFVVGEFLSNNMLWVLVEILPLFFIFIVTYHLERLTFFDVLIKQGAFIFQSLVLLTLYFALVPPLLWRLRFSSWIGSIAWAATVWPIVLLAPWGHRKLSAWLDRHFLGRRFSTAEATKYFLAGLQGAIDEGELAQEAERHLNTIFRSEANVCLVSSSPVALNGNDSMNAPIRLNGEVVGEIRVRRREYSRFLSEDAALLASLADGLAFLIENLRLREKRLLQEQRERELLLNANRSELKALRAQINPHFLFNALNTIAALIPRQPDRAEETVEELAEVFRYTLRRSEREWVQLDEELEAVRSYLHIEQARFGDGLRFQIETVGDTANARIPAMMIQTLVENSVKHGIAPLSTPGFVEVRVDVSQPQLQIEVRDNGRGFESSVMTNQSRSRNGYGLHNVEERLQRYFGEKGRLTISRDALRNMTLVHIEMPQFAQIAGVPTA